MVLISSLTGSLGISVAIGGLSRLGPSGSPKGGFSRDAPALSLSRIQQHCVPQHFVCMYTSWGVLSRFQSRCFYRGALGCMGHLLMNVIPVLNYV